MSPIPASPFAPLIGSAPEFQALLRSAQIVAAVDVPVLIEGETGTGKELLARALHAASPRATGAFVAINCAALPEGLAEAELFGHRRGAFTDARHERAGYVRAAAGGTLFLDEVGELSLATQARLLRFLEHGEVQGVGEDAPTRVDVRVIAATNRDLAAEVQTGAFRRDLYYRLQVVPLTLPPLRARAEDVPALARHFVARFAERQGLSAPSFSPATLGRLREHAWPGNIRELRNLCERLCVLLPGRTIEPENLPAELRAPPAAQGGTGFRLPAGGVDLEALEADMLRQALERTQGNKSRAARLLGLTRDTFLYRLKKYAIPT